MRDTLDKCCLENGIEIRPDGINILDACTYQDIEMHTNVTVVISKCKICGHIEISWLRTDNTEDIYE